MPDYCHTKEKDMETFDAATLALLDALEADLDADDLDFDCDEVLTDDN